MRITLGILLEIKNDRGQQRVVETPASVLSDSIKKY